jgi:hypothetical protein
MVLHAAHITEPKRKPTSATLRTIAKRCGEFFGESGSAVPLFLGPALPLIQYRVESKKQAVQLAQNLRFDSLWHFQIQDTEGTALHWAWVRIEQRHAVRLEATGGKRFSQLVAQALHHAKNADLKVLDLVTFPAYAMAALRVCASDGAVCFVVADPPSYAGLNETLASFAKSLKCGTITDEAALFAWLKSCPPAFGLDFSRRRKQKERVQK